MNILIILIVGGLIGWAASMLVGGGGGILMNIVVGIVGAFIGGFVFSQFGAQGITGFNIGSIFVAFIGAVILLGIIRLVTGRNGVRT